MDTIGSFQGGNIFYSSEKGQEYILFTQCGKAGHPSNNDTIVYSFGFPGLDSFNLGFEMGIHFTQKGMDVAIPMYDGLKYEKFFTLHRHSTFPQFTVRTPTEPERKDYSFPENIKKITRIRKKLKGEGRKIHLAGISYGVAFSLSSLIDQKGDVASVVAINPVFRYGQIFEDFANEYHKGETPSGIERLVHDGIDSGAIRGEKDELIDQLRDRLKERYPLLNVHYPDKAVVLSGEHDFNSTKKAASQLIADIALKKGVAEAITLPGADHDISNPIHRNSLFSTLEKILRQT